MIYNDVYYACIVQNTSKLDMNHKIFKNSFKNIRKKCLYEKYLTLQK